MPQLEKPRWQKVRQRRPSISRRVNKSGVRVPKAIFKAVGIKRGDFVGITAEGYGQISVRGPENPIWHMPMRLQKKRNRKRHAPRKRT